MLQLSIGVSGAAPAIGDKEAWLDKLAKWKSIVSVPAATGPCGT